jgi:hypothetical protein
VPRAFRDALPLRLSKFRSRPMPATVDGPFLYGDVEPWINAEPVVRRDFVSLWRSKAGEAPFRTALEHDLPMHPEWEPVLHARTVEAPSPGRPAASVARSDPASR